MHVQHHHDDTPAKCDYNKFLLPNDRDLLSDHQNKIEILYRMCDQSCQHLFLDVQGVLGQLVLAAKDGSGCECTIKITNDRYMRMCDFGPGPNRYEVALRIDVSQG